MQIITDPEPDPGGFKNYRAFLKILNGHAESNIVQGQNASDPDPNPQHWIDKEFTG